MKLNTLMGWFCAILVAGLSLSILANHAAAKVRHASTDTAYAVHITNVPPSGAGENSAGTISGTAAGPNVDNLKVVVYAITDQSYVQPWADAPYTNISGKKWSTGTHLGWHYAALLVRPSYKPPSITDGVPSVGGDILAVSKADPK